jgi:hypothetical protein
LARIDGPHDRGDWKANGTGLSGDFRRAPQIRRICIAPWRSKSLAAHDWLRAAKRAMCVSLGQQIARLEEDHI